MKTQIALAGVSLSLLGSLISVSSAEAAGLFSNGDTIFGSSGGTGLFNLAGEGDFTGEFIYFGTELAGIDDGIIINGFEFAQITNPTLAPTSTAETNISFGATGGFETLNDAQFRSFKALPFTIVNDFITMTDDDGLTVSVDINGVIQSSVGVGDAITLEIPVIVTGDDGVDIQVVDGIFRFSAANIGNFEPLVPPVVDPSVNGEPVYTLDIASELVSYSWQVDVIKQPVAEPSSILSLLALSALGAGMAIKRKVSK